MNGTGKNLSQIIFSITDLQIQPRVLEQIKILDLVQNLHVIALYSLEIIYTH